MASFEQLEYGWWRATTYLPNGQKVAMTAATRETVDKWVDEVEAGREGED